MVNYDEAIKLVPITFKFKMCQYSLDLPGINYFSVVLLWSHIPLFLVMIENINLS